MPRPVVALTVGMSVVLLAGCTGPGGGGSAAASPTPPATVGYGTPDGDRTSAALPTPAVSAGPLGEANLPPPAALGPGWTSYADPGNSAEGYVGNGSWVRARTASDVVAGVVPVGCSGLGAAPALPAPVDALEATYRGPGGSQAVGLVLRFADAAGAVDFQSQYAALLRSCPPPSRPVQPTDPLHLTVRVVTADADQLTDVRTEAGAGASGLSWQEVVVRRGDRVGLLVAGTPRPADAGRLADLAAAVAAGLTR